VIGITRYRTQVISWEQKKCYASLREGMGTTIRRWSE
jgi:hypothetical protein